RATEHVQLPAVAQPVEAGRALAGSASAVEFLQHVAGEHASAESLLVDRPLEDDFEDVLHLGQGEGFRQESNGKVGVLAFPAYASDRFAHQPAMVEGELHALWAPVAPQRQPANIARIPDDLACAIGGNERSMEQGDRPAAWIALAPAVRRHLLEPWRVDARLLAQH